MKYKEEKIKLPPQLTIECEGKKKDLVRFFEEGILARFFCSLFKSFENCKL